MGLVSDMEYKMIIHDAKDKLPLKSGTYIVKTSKHFNLWQVLSYSAKFKKFNTYDSQENDKDAVNGYMWAELPGEDSEVERVTCPDCNGGGVYQEYDEYDRYHVYTCYKCEGTGEITRQSAEDKNVPTREEVQKAIVVVNEKIYRHREYIKLANKSSKAINLKPEYDKIDALELAITAQQEYQLWIPVSERLPTEEDARQGMVLAWSSQLDEWQVETVRYVKKNTADDYTHWKPLPEPPKGK